MMRNLLNLYDFNSIDTHPLLWSDPNISHEINKSIFEIVQKIIKDSR